MVTSRTSLSPRRIAPGGGMTRPFAFSAALVHGNGFTSVSNERSTSSALGFPSLPHQGDVGVEEVGELVPCPPSRHHGLRGALLLGLGEDRIDVRRDLAARLTGLLAGLGERVAADVLAAGVEPPRPVRRAT